ncbi:MAG: hypothetical protein AMJ72_03960 [Acidithiobacillales bacterium SM1_46]|jgi:CXXC-20-CXXC protein|nr:MAG: hypothetical protein AMJ72_03960 [Acidithiobacillales bacterium SM1_46]
MPQKLCPHCDQPLPNAVVWKSLFAGQTAHSCPACGKRFRLTYTAKRRVAYLNVALMLGIMLLIGSAMWKDWPDLLRYLLIYLVIAAGILFVLPFLARFERTSAPYR